MRLRLLFSFLILSLLIASFQEVFAQITQKNGFKYFKNYTPKEYDNATQNWGALQDTRGIIYIANLGGVLEFDGFSWRSYEVPNKSVYSLAVDGNGTIYIGGKNEIGFMTMGSNGTLEYKSLSNYLFDKHKNFGSVWATHSTKKGVFFQSSHYMFRWQDEKLEVLESGGKDRSFHTSFYCNGNLFVRQRKVGLMQVLKGSLKLITECERFAELLVYMMVPFDKRHMLIGTRRRGFFLFDGVKLEPFPTEVDDYIKEKNLYQGIRLSSNDFALATQLGGLVIIDSRGKLKHIFNTKNGLQNDRIKYVFEDYQGNLWLCLNKGISKIEYHSPISIYDDRSGLTDLVLSVEKHQNGLYAATYNGLYSLLNDGKFHPVPGVSSINWDLLTTDNSVLTATTHGIFQVMGGINDFFVRKVAKVRSYILHRSRKDTKRVWVGTRKGLVSIYLKNNNWAEEHKFENISKEIKSIVETQNGYLWLGLSAKSVVKVEFPGEETIFNPIIKEYNNSNGLPDTAVRVYMINNRAIFATDNGLYRFDEKRQVFIPDFLLGEQFAGGEKGRPVFRMTEDGEGNIWLHSNRRNVLAMRQKDGSFKIIEKSFLRLPPGQANAIYPDPDRNSIWFACNEGLIRYEKGVEKDYNLDYGAVIRRVWINENMVFGGHKAKRNNDPGSGQSFPVIDYKDRNLRFEFAAPFFEGEEKTQYSCRLEGYEKDWTAWGKDNKANYNNLNAGMYTFRVRAKNVYGNVSREDTYRFRVLPPWYQTWWAYLIYVLAGIFFMFLVVKWRSGKLARDKKRLEQVVEERTEQLREQSEKLKEMDRVKSRFFANISHEFRTPLTLILGPLDQMIDACEEGEAERKRKLTMMLRNGQRLLRLINQLLELSKLDSGKMKLRAVKTAIVPFVKGIADSFRVLTQQKELELMFRGEPKDEEAETMVYIDARKMEDVLTNLLVNAIKFTPAGGEVRVAVKSNPMADTNFPAGYVEISVCDTGPGIPEEQLAHVFDRFFQADSTYEYHQKGSGIGLALSKELVELHHGAIRVENRQESGSRFVVRLPLGEAHLSVEEIVEEDASVDVEPGSEDILASGGQGALLKNRPLDPRKIFDSYKTGEKNIILVVEDSVDMRDYIRGALEQDYIIEEAGDGREGIEKAREIIPDLIISDIMMPEADGYELCRTLKNDVSTSHVPVILLTAKASEENVIEGLQTGADDYITKPFSTKILLARIRNLIDIRAQLQQNINREMTLQPVKTAVSEIDREFLREIHDVINKNISDEDFNVEQLCKKLYIGRTTLYRKIMALSGLTPTEFIRSYRLKRGAELLKQNYGTVLEVALEVGFSNSSYFAKCFKEKFHRLPSEYHAANKE